MEWLNYHHLLYFYTVAREGSVKQAAGVLRLAQPTLSGQIRKLEESLGEQLFDRRRRRLELTETGELVYRYADEIFSTGREMLDALRGRATHRPARLQVGVADVVPKLLAYRLLQTALELEEEVQLVLHEGKTEDLIGELGRQRYDMVLTDVPLPPHSPVRAFNHLLGHSGVGFFAAPEVARRHRRGFPQSLDGAPLLAPTPNTALRHSLDRWLDGLGVRPELVAEIEDSALMKVFGQNGVGLFAAPLAVEDEIRRSHGVQLVGRTEEVQEHFYAITLDRRIMHPAVAAIAERARSGVLA